MTEKHCKICTNIKVYDDRYRCMICFKEFIVAEEEDVMNTATVAPAIARIQELETENTSLKCKLEALMKIVNDRYNPSTRKGWPGGLLEDEPKQGDIRYED